MVDMLINGKSVKALVDTGASVSLFDFDTLTSIYPDLKEVTSTAGKPMEVHSVTGQPISIIDCVEIPLEIKGRRMKRTFLAVQGMKNHQVILGYDMMKEESMVVDAADNTVYFKEPESTGTWKAAELTVTAKTTLWPRSIQHVKVAAMVNGRTVEPGQTGIVLPRPSNTIGVWESLNETGERGTMTVAVVNMSRSKVT